MYGTVARLRVKPSSLDQLREHIDDYDRLTIPGLIHVTLYQMESDPNEVYLVVLFRDRASYQGNARSVEQDDRYRVMRSLLVVDPEWHDGEVLAHRAHLPG